MWKKQRWSLVSPFLNQRGIYGGRNEYHGRRVD